MTIIESSNTSLHFINHSSSVSFQAYTLSTGISVLPSRISRQINDFFHTSGASYLPHYYVIQVTHHAHFMSRKSDRREKTPIVRDGFFDRPLCYSLT